MKWTTTWRGAIGLGCFLLAWRGEAQEQQRRDLELMRILSPTKEPRGRINALDATWEAWQKRTGALPPDFAAMRSQPFLPDPLEGVRTPADWPARRAELKRDLQQWITGHMPPAPGNVRAVVTGERRDGGALVRDVRLEFGPEHRGILHVQVIIPPGKGPFPVFLTNHNRSRPWAATAVARGYIGCIYRASDPYYGEEDDSDKFIELYPDYDFSCLARWAWAASRAIDYLVTLPEVDAAKIGITGHSRNGKAALTAAAYDERIGAVVASGGNTGESNPWRYTSDPFANETMERIIEVNPHWFSLRLRFFIGREDKLPVDQNSMFALVAPRGAMMASAYTESANSALGFEQNYRSVRRVYDFLGAPAHHLSLHLRQGLHGTSSGDIEGYVDFFDRVFGRSARPVPQTFILGYTFEEWKKISRETKGAVPTVNRVRWALGEEPALISLQTPTNPGPVLAGDGGWIRQIAPLPVDRSMKIVPVALGVDLKADLYLPAEGTAPRPLVIWLHPFAHANGYAWKAKAPFVELIRRGYAVLSFDQIGFGTRIEHAKDFYQRYPHWSLLGKMVADTRSAITAAAGLKEIDASRIYLLGYALGGKVALWTAALDDRPAGVISVAGFTPLRTSRDTEGIRAYSHLHGLVPRFGFYADTPAELPLDYDDVLRAIGPRRTLVVAPTHDRHADLAALQRLVQPFKQVELATPEEFNRFTPEIQRLVFDWLDGTARVTPPTRPATKR
ncbi:alpha/beta hydrolase family protein [Horticoccus sp. 23ND18S-11]|uniref:alpha/beta hydrolase family protein n=1 Tax=Horticoccus sp. 23ND18S-11 TaxID=3391832 RepID=UPI0039C90DF9